MKWGKRADLIVHGDDPFNAEPPSEVLAGEPVTALDAFYVRNNGPVPELDPGSWRLCVDGLTERELELSLEDLQTDFAHHDLAATLQCAGNRRAGYLSVRDIPGEAPWGPGATGTAIWSGVRLADVLAAAGIREAVAYVALRGADVSEGPDPPQLFGASIPRAKATADETLLAWGMNGEPLPSVHGVPLRVVVPGYVGARSVKWLERVTAQPGRRAISFRPRATGCPPRRGTPTPLLPERGWPSARLRSTPTSCHQTTARASHSARCGSRATPSPATTARSCASTSRATEGEHGSGPS